MVDSNSSKPGDEAVEGRSRGEASVFDVDDDIWLEEPAPEALTEFSVGIPVSSPPRGSTQLRRRAEASEPSKEESNSFPPSRGLRRDPREEASAWRSPQIERSSAEDSDSEFDPSSVFDSVPDPGPEAPVESARVARARASSEEAAWPRSESGSDLESLDLSGRSGVTGLLDQIIDEAVQEGDGGELSPSGLRAKPVSKSASPGGRPERLPPFAPPREDRHRAHAGSVEHSTGPIHAADARAVPPFRPRSKAPLPYSPGAVAADARPAMRRPSVSRAPLPHPSPVDTGAAHDPGRRAPPRAPSLALDALDPPAVGPSLTDDLVLDSGPPPAGDKRSHLPASANPAFAHPAGRRAVAVTGQPASLVDPSVEVKPAPGADVQRNLTTDVRVAEMERAVAASVETSIRVRPAPAARSMAPRSARQRVVMGRRAESAERAVSLGDGSLSGLELDESRSQSGPRPLRRPARLHQHGFHQISQRPQWPRYLALVLLICLLGVVMFAVARNL